MSRMNEASWDRIARVVVGLALLYLGWAGVVSSPWGTLLGVIGVVFLVTGVIGWCPLYALLRIRTRRD